MITESVKNLFSFIDFLHGKTDYFLCKQNLVDDVLELLTKRNSLRPDQNFKDRIEYNKVQAELKKEFDVLKEETTNIIIEKIQELNIADISTPITNLNAQGGLFELQRNFSENDLEEIFEAKRKYVEFRTKTNFDYFIVPFFGDLDRELKEFFDYFNEVGRVDSIEINSVEELLNFFESTGSVVSPSKIEYNKDGTHKVTGWAINDPIKDFAPLKKYIRENYLNVHPNKFTLERLEQIKRNISTWKLKLKDTNEAPEIQEFISETIADIDLKIDRFGTNEKKTESELSYMEKRQTEPAKWELLETIKKELEPLRQAFNSDTEFQKAITAIQNFFFNKGKPEQTIFIKNGNIKNLAFALGEIWRSKRNEVITLEYLQFYKSAFSIFANQSIDERNIFGSNLYKYSISKT